MNQSKFGVPLNSVEWTLKKIALFCWGLGLALVLIYRYFKFDFEPIHPGSYLGGFGLIFEQLAKVPEAVSFVRILAIFYIVCGTIITLGKPVLLRAMMILNRVVQAGIVLLGVLMILSLPALYFVGGIFYILPAMVLFLFFAFHRKMNAYCKQAVATLAASEGSREWRARFRWAAPVASLFAVSLFFSDWQAPSKPIFKVFELVSVVPDEFFMASRAPYLATSSKNDTAGLQVWDISQPFRGGVSRNRFGGKWAYDHLISESPKDISPDGSALASASTTMENGSEFSRLRIWSLELPHKSHPYYFYIDDLVYTTLDTTADPVVIEIARAMRITALTYALEGSKVYIGTAQGEVGRMNLQKKQLEDIFQACDCEILELSLDPSGEKLAVLGRPRHGKYTFYDNRRPWILEKGIDYWPSYLEKRRYNLSVWNVHERSRGLFFDLDSMMDPRLFSASWLVSAPTLDKPLFWDLTSGKARSLNEKLDSHVLAVAISPKGDRAALAFMESIVLYKLPDLKRIGAIHHHYEWPVAPITISPDGTLLAGANRIRETHSSRGNPIALKVWDLRRIPVDSTHASRMEEPFGRPAQDDRGDADAATPSLGDPRLTAAQVDSILERLHQAARHKEASVRRSAAVELGKGDDPRAVDLLITLLLDEDTNVIIAAHQSLNGSKQEAKVVEALIAVLQEKKIPMTAWNLVPNILILKEKKDPRAIGVLAGLLAHEDMSVRQNAVHALGAIGTTQALQPLVPSLKDEAELVRSSAATVLGKSRDPRLFKPLLAALKDSDPSVRNAAHRALVHMTGVDFQWDIAKWMEWWAENKKQIR